MIVACSFFDEMFPLIKKAMKDNIHALFINKVPEKGIILIILTMWTKIVGDFLSLGFELCLSA